MAERNLNLSQPHRILVLVRGDCRKKSQSIPTTHRILVLVRGDCRKEFQSILTTQVLVSVKGDWQKESQFSPTTHRTLGPVEVLGQSNFETTSFRRPILFYLYNTYYAQIFAP